VIDVIKGIFAITHNDRSFQLQTLSENPKQQKKTKTKLQNQNKENIKSKILQTLNSFTISDF